MSHPESPVSAWKRNAGPIGAFVYSGANFFLAFLLQSSVPAAEFGLYAFALVLVQFGTGLSNALFASPVVVWIEDQSVARDALLRSFALANALAITLGTAGLALILRASGMSDGLVWLVCAQAAALWIRWFLRAVELASHGFLRSAAADVVYGSVTLLAGGALFLWFGVAVVWALVAMLAGTIASLLPVGRGTIGLVLGGLPSLTPFRRAFRRHGSWALLGVTTTEVTTNLHSYVLTLWLGPAAFAPVATLSLFFRPIPILTQALTQFERPVLARMIRHGAADKVDAAVRRMSGLVTGAVVLNTLGLVALVLFAQPLIGAGQYAAQDLWPLLALLACAQLVRGLRTGPSAALQSAGAFRALAFTTLYAAAVTLLGTAAALFAGENTLWLILTAVLCGEVLSLILTRKTYRLTLSATLRN